MTSLASQSLPWGRSEQLTPACKERRIIPQTYKSSSPPPPNSVYRRNVIFFLGVFFYFETALCVSNRQNVCPSRQAQHASGISARHAHTITKYLWLAAMTDGGVGLGEVAAATSTDFSPPLQLKLHAEACDVGSVFVFMV